MKKLGILLLAAAFAVCGLMTFAACNEETLDPGDDPIVTPGLDDPDDPGKPEEPDEPDVHTHNFGEWEVVTEPTCTEEGLRERVCACGEKESEEIAALGHTPGEAVKENEVAATCTAGGSYEEVVYCEICKQELRRKRVAVEAHGHNYVDDFCTHCGQQAYTEGLSFELWTDGTSYYVADYKGTLPRVNIPRNYQGLPVTHIGRAFSYCKNLSKVEIPDSVTSIGSNAFAHSSISNITIPDNVISIGDSAFSYCDSLMNVTISDGVIEIGEKAFSDCKILSKVEIPDSVTSIGSNAFYNCDRLTSVTIGDGMTSIGAYAFSDCNSLTSVTIGDGMTSIGAYAFSGCNSLTSVKIPGNITSIGTRAFDYCISLTSVAIGNGVTSIGSSAFNQCYSLTSIKIPDSVTSIGSWAFFNTAYYNDASNWNNDVLYIGNHLIEAGTIVGNYSVRKGTKTIADEAFSGCGSLRGIAIPNSVTSIGEWAFGFCYGLSSITVDRGNPVYHSNGNCLIETKSKTLIAGCGKSVIPANGSVTSIGEGAFSSRGYLKSITIPDSVTSIGNSAFNSCDSLESITIGNGVTSIGNNAFNSCDSLESITIDDSVTFIGEGAFDYCSRLKTVYYRGSEAEWNEIEIGADNDDLLNAEIVFNYTGE